jgi:hypothetical protein
MAIAPVPSVRLFCDELGRIKKSGDNTIGTFFNVEFGGIKSVLGGRVNFPDIF